MPGNLGTWEILVLVLISALTINFLLDSKIIPEFIKVGGRSIDKFKKSVKGE